MVPVKDRSLGFTVNYRGSRRAKRLISLATSDGEPGHSGPGTTSALPSFSPRIRRAKWPLVRSSRITRSSTNLTWAGRDPRRNLRQELLALRLEVVHHEPVHDGAPEDRQCQRKVELPVARFRHRGVHDLEILSLWNGGDGPHEDDAAVSQGEAAPAEAAI